MSHNIYKSIKQNKDGSFEGLTAESNVFDCNGRYVFNNFKNDYFNWKMPEATNEQRRIAWIFSSIQAGDVYYPTAWKDELNLVNTWAEKNNFSCWYYGERPEDWENINNCLKFIKETKQKRKKYKVLMRGWFVKRKTAHKVSITPYENEAKVYNKTLEELQQLFKFYEEHNPQFIPQE